MTLPTTLGRPSTVSPEQKKRLIDRLARVEGQVRGIQRMIDREEECEAIAQQVAAARGALNRAFAELVACAFEHQCDIRLTGDPERVDRLAKIASLIAKYG